MKLFKYGIVLKRITRDDIELVRQWRNAECISKHMQYRDFITREQQKKWFRSIDNINNFYYLIYHKDTPIGLFNEKNIDWKTRTSETGLFIWDDRYIDSHIPLMASLMLSEMGFYVFEGRYSYAHVLRVNEKARNYVLNFGYVLCEGEEDKEVQRFVLSREAFEKKGARLLKAMERLYPGDNVLKMQLEPNDYRIGVGQALESAFAKSPKTVRKEVKENGTWFYYP